jgi:hypothetical protein
VIITRSGGVAFDTEVRDMPLARSIHAPTVLRAAAGSDTLGRLVVKFTAFNVWYRVDSWWEGTFMERTAPGAFTRSINARGPKGTGMIRSLFDHGWDMMIGDKILTVPGVPVPRHAARPRLPAGPARRPRRGRHGPPRSPRRGPAWPR